MNYNYIFFLTRVFTLQFHLSIQVDVYGAFHQNPAF
jgi:hypothetical protein